MKIRMFNFGKDYPEICEWWRERGWPVVSKRHLPNNGLVAEKDGVKYAAIWVYVDGTMGWMEWLVTNPKAPLRGRKKSIEALLEYIKKEASHIGVERVCTLTENKNLIELYQEHGFKIGDKNMTSLVLEVAQ